MKMSYNMPDDCSECEVCGKPYFGSFPDCEHDELTMEAKKAEKQAKQLKGMWKEVGSI